MFSKEQEHILGYITEKEKQIRDTEDNMRKKAEKDKQKAVKETEEKLKEHSRTSSTVKTPVNNEKKHTYIFIQVNELNETVTDGLIRYCQNNNIKFYLEER